VEIGGTTYIADPGFGGLALTGPLRLRPDVEQKTPHETYRLTGGDPDWQLEARLGEEWHALYRFEPLEYAASDYEAANALLGNDPASPFTQELRIALSPPGLRLKLKDARFTTQAPGQPAETRLMTDLAQLRGLLVDSFGIDLPDDSRLDGKLEGILVRHSAES
jgi:N-hydroxyarylamine O-acetyltransferase